MCLITVYLTVPVARHAAAASEWPTAAIVMTRAGSTHERTPGPSANGRQNFERAAWTVRKERE
jgi:hypothetical protein